MSKSFFNSGNSVTEVRESTGTRPRSILNVGTSSNGLFTIGVPVKNSNLTFFVFIIVSYSRIALYDPLVMEFAKL